MVQTANEPATAQAVDAQRQHTLAGPVEVTGKGLLLGEDARIVIEPAPADHGIVFERIDLDPPVRIPARATNVASRSRRTTLKIGQASIETVEHCMSALAGLRIDNALIKVSGPELPCGDGSAAPFVEPILKVGTVTQNATRRTFKLVEPILVQHGDAMLAAFPSERDSFEVVFDLDYGQNSDRIKRQTFAFSMAQRPGPSLNGEVSHEASDDSPASDNGTASRHDLSESGHRYVHEISRARTYSLKEEAQALWERGMCRHLTPKDVLVIGDEGPIDNAYRFENEPVRHKIVDLLGDLYMVGCEVHGRFVAHKSGHELNRLMCLRILDQMEAVARRSALSRSAAMDIRSIQRIMPHRYPMLLVDRVLELDGDRKAIGVKNVSINEPFFAGHYPGTPIMPGVLIVEAMAQLGGLLMSQKLEHTGKIAVLLSLDRVKLRRPVMPGDQLVLEAESVRARPRTCAVKCRALVSDKVAAEAQVRFMMVDAEQD